MRVWAYADLAELTPPPKLVCPPVRAAVSLHLAACPISRAACGDTPSARTGRQNHFGFSPDALPRELARRNIAAQSVPHWCLPPDFDLAPLFHSALCSPTPQTLSFHDGAVQIGRQASPRRREHGQCLAGLTAAPEVSLPSVSRRRDAPPGCVPYPPREPAETPRRPAPHGRTARPRVPLDFFPAGPPRELAQRNISARSGPVGA